MANREAEKRARREARLAAEAEAAKKAARDRNLRIGGGAAAVIVVVAVVVALVAGGGGGSSAKQAPLAKNLAPAFGSYAGLPGVQSTPPPWNAGALDLANRLKAIGLPQLGAEGTATHIHAHMDLFVKGHREQVPELVGIQPQGKFLTILHTHDTTGVLHIESPDAGQQYSLGQFFAVWGVPLGPTGIGSLKTGGGNMLKMWVNGKPFSSPDPGRLILTAHAEIVLAYGTAAQMPKTIPAKYSFPAGL